MIPVTVPLVLSDERLCAKNLVSCGRADPL